MRARRLLSFLLSIVLIFSFLPVTVAAADSLPVFPEISAEAFGKITGNDNPLKNIFQFYKELPRYDWGPDAPEPAKFEGVTYKLADNVVKVNPEVTKNIRSIRQVQTQGIAASGSIDGIIGQGGLIKADQLQAAAGLSAIKPGSVFVDLENGLAFKTPTQPFEAGEEFQGYLPVIKPEIQEVIKDFKIPSQTVQLNKSNIAHFAEDADGNKLDKYLKKPGQTYVMSQNTSTDMGPIGPTHLKDPIAEFYFPSEGITLNGSTPSGGEVSINVKGYLGIGDMSLNGYYDKWDYALYFSMEEEMQLQAVLAAELKEEVRIPILGVDIGFNSDIGSIAGGLFLIVGIDGDFTLRIESRQWTTLDKAGLKGKNFFYVPCSIRPLFTLGDCGFSLDSQFNGKMNGYVKAGALLELNLLGLDIVGAGTFVGMGANSAVAGEYIETDLYGIVQAYAKFLGKQKNLINWQPTIMHKRQANTAGYIVTFKEACAYRDEVWGTLFFDAGVKGNVPEPNKDITLHVRNTQGIEKTYTTKTTENGSFHFPGVELRKDDDVYIRLQERNGTDIVRSDSITPTFPFDSVIVQEADFFNDYVKGYVPSVIVKDWSNDGQKEIVFDPGKSQDSSITVRLSNKELPVTLDEKGFFDLRAANVLPSDIASCKLTFDGWAVISNSIEPTVEFQAQAIRMPVSYEKTVENGKPADVTHVSERVIITNMRGTKQYTGAADFIVNGYTQEAAGCYIISPDTGLPIMTSFGLPEQKKSVELIAMKDDDTESLGSSYFVNTIVKKWYWEPKPSKASATRNLTNIKLIPAVKPESVEPTAVIPGIRIQSKEMDIPELLQGAPQHIITLLYDDLFDSYEGYKYDIYSDLVDGSYTIRWDDKIVITYEGAKITLEYKDDRKDTDGDSKFETLTGDWTGKNVEMMLNRYMEKMGKSLVFPMPDEIMKETIK
ncbi:MAG TPA: hypothetical protein P5021_00810, partial [Candidatus Diapherotrites archaeon]|nr:hypothetical protein [Candidatus Diapherotrites archaeon]